MRAQALGGKLKKGEFRIGRISLSALVQVAHSLTHSRRSRNPSSNEWDSATDGLPHQYHSESQKRRGGAARQCQLYSTYTDVMPRRRFESLRH